MTKLFFEGFVDMLRGQPVHKDILTYAKTEYKREWQHEYNRLVAQLNTTGKWSTK
jgi:hypothetical protein